MAGDSLGTMTVGVTANVSDAERALNALANLLEKFDRQQQNRQRSSASRQPSFAGLPKYGPYSEEQQFAEMLRKEQVQKQALTKWTLSEIRKSEERALETRGTESHMSGLAAKFRAEQRREINDLQVYAERQEQIQKQAIDDLQIWAERQERIANSKAERLREAQNREINDLQAYAERKEAEERRLIDDLQAYAEHEVRVEQRKAERKFQSQQASLNREYAAGGRRAGDTGAGYFSPMSPGFAEEMKRREDVERRTQATLRLREIRRSEEMAANSRQVNENMQGLGEAFKSGGAAGAEEYLNRTNRAIAQVGDTSARTRYAVLNLGYGIQDAVQVFGTSGLAGAVRASANNLQGLGVLFDKTAGGMKGLTSALMSGEFVVMGIATAVLLAADAWEKYNKKIQEANAAESQERFKRLKPERAVEEAGREEALNRELARMQKLQEADAKRKELADALAGANAKLNAAAKEEASIKGDITRLQKQIVEYERVRGLAPAGGRRPGGRDADVPRRTAEEEAAFRAIQERGGLAKAKEDLAELQKKAKEFAASGNAPEAVLRERDMLQKELNTVEKRTAQLQPEAIQNAKRELDMLKQQVQSLDNREKLERDAIKDAQQRLNVIKQEDQLEENARVKRAKYMEAMREAVTRGEQREVKKDKQYRITEDELRAQERSFQRSRDREAVEKKVAAFDASMEKIAAERAATQKKIASIEQTYPQFSPKEQLLEMQQSDMEYRVSFLNKKRREVEARMRRGDQFTGVAQFESATAYEALARSRMGPAPEADTLRKILVAEEKATAALEDIREKLDPGRRERLVILESFE